MSNVHRLPTTLAVNQEPRAPCLGPPSRALKRRALTPSPDPAAPATLNPKREPTLWCQWQTSTAGQGHGRANRAEGAAPSQGRRTSGLRMSGGGKQGKNVGGKGSGGARARV
eukprot:356488-Chlamydomonas_euryale.AAC.12